MNRQFYLLALSLCGFLYTAGADAQRLERGNLVFDNVAPVSAELAERVDAYFSGREARVLGWSPQNQLLILTRFGDASQLHLVERPGGERRQLSFGPEAVLDGAFSPDPARASFVFTRDQGGDGKSQIYDQRLGEAATRRVTDGKSRNLAAVWSNSGHEIAFATTARDGQSVDIDIVTPESGALPRLALSGDGGAWYPLDWSPDDSQLLALKVVSARESHLFLVDLDSGKRRELAGGNANADITTARFARDAQGAYFVSDRDSEFKQLRFINFFTGQDSLLSGHVAGDVRELAVSRDGHYLAFVSDAGGVDSLQILDLRAHQDLTPPHMRSPGLIDSLAFDATGTHLAFSFSATSQPRDAYVLEIASNQVEQWTHSETGSVDVAKFVSPRLIEFPSFDRENLHGRDVPAYLYEPAGTGPGGTGTHPVVIWLTGGVDSPFRPGFNPEIQCLVGEGYAVIAPNLRGSNGYGKSYAALDEGRSREDAVKDIGALLVWLRGQKTLDADHVVVAGAGYGGYLALGALADFGDRLRGAIDAAGIVDFVGLISDAPSFRQGELRKQFGDERDPETRIYLRRISPLSNGERMTKPVLILQGKNDPEVPENQSQEMVNRLRSRGADVRYLLVDDEGHSFRKLRNRQVYWETIVAFLASLH